ncbi:hypothetical protein NPIL_627271 [Nephila pilipes]|uniref:Uncharacterized protein n=1 Tax=Nephila pilipes TaxID=299642 RepID=A0A8X6N5Z1_NEPPI|nr:hypothetical protein NPIL_627271 [Nephila pilipes]
MTDPLFWKREDSPSLRPRVRRRGEREDLEPEGFSLLVGKGPDCSNPPGVICYSVAEAVGRLRFLWSVIDMFCETNSN